MERKKYPIGSEHYALYEEVGQGVSASVHRALCIPLDEVVAIKILDFERDNSDLVLPCSSPSCVYHRLVCIKYLSRRNYRRGQRIFQKLVSDEQRVVTLQSKSPPFRIKFPWPVISA